MDNVFIKTIIEYYDNCTIQVNNFLEKVRYIKFINGEFTNSIIFMDENNKELLTSKIEMLGYLTNSNIWSWSWSHPRIENKYTNISRNFLNYALSLIHSEHLFMKNTFINSKVVFHNNNNQFDIFLALLAYKCKTNMIFSMPNIDKSYYVQNTDVIIIDYLKMKNDKSYKLLFYYVIVDF
jgi:hypothetical protein